MQTKGFRPLDTTVHGPYTRYMANRIQYPDRLNDSFRPAEEKTSISGFRILESQFLKLESEYKGNRSAIIRFLLNKFFSPDTPELKAEFDNKLINLPKP